MSKRPRRNHARAFKVTVASAAVRKECTLIALSTRLDVHHRDGAAAEHASAAPRPPSLPVSPPAPRGYPAERGMAARRSSMRTRARNLPARCSSACSAITAC